MPSILLVTACDAGFFPLLRGLLLSIARHRASPAADVAVFDLGLTDVQRAWAGERVRHLVEPSWDLAVPAAVREARPQARALTVRPFLPRYFPGYDIYLWIDADVWLQDWQGIALYCLGAQQRDLAVTPHSDRAYAFNRSVFRYRYREFVRSYGKSVADDLAVQHHLNAGVFAARGSSPLWAAWAEAFQSAIDATEGARINDQVALNVACYRQRLTWHLLPALCNWQCHLALPAWDPEVGRFCEPHLPHAAISLVHLTHKTKDATYALAGLDGRRYRMTLRYPEASAAG